MYTAFIIFIIFHIVQNLPVTDGDSEESDRLWSGGQLIESESSDSDVLEGEDLYPITRKPITLNVKLNQTIINAMKYFIPNVTNENEKGFLGRVAVVGGSKENSGSPYLAAMAALRTGADMAYIFCPKSAATAIKAYSPEIMVHPCLDLEDSIDCMLPWLKLVNILIIGPGLGQPSKRIQKNIIKIIKYKAEEWTDPVPLVVDADAFIVLYNQYDLIDKYPGQIYLTPNKKEFIKFTAHTFGVDRKEVKPKKHLITLAENFERDVLIILKGRRDRLAHHDVIIKNLAESSPRRTTGQGDLLSGCLGVFASWIYKVYFEEFGEMSPELVAAFSASTVIKLANKLAFKEKGRSMITTDVLNNIHKAYQMVFHSKTVPNI